MKHRTKRQLFTTIITLILFISTSCAQKRNIGEINQKIESYLLELEKIGFDGSVLVEVKGEKIISEGFGYSNKERKLKNSPATIYDIGSITKQFTAAAIMKLEMQGKLSTEDKISKYLENIPEDKKEITIHDLLRHQSGLISNVGKDYEKIDKEEFLNKVLSSDLRFEVGSDFSYSNVGYSLLAMIIEKVAGQSYEAYLYKNLWKPTNMKMTGYSRPKFDKDKIAVGYYIDDKVWGKPTDKEWDKTAPYWHLKGNGGILSTIEDLYKWHKGLMKDKILSKEAKQKLYHPKIRPEEDYNKAIYAYGWDVSKTNRNTTLAWHNGGNNILYADFLRYIDDKVTVIMLTNKSHPNFDNLSFEISQIIFNPNYYPEIPTADNDTNRIFTNKIIKVIEDQGINSAKNIYNNKKENESLLEFTMRKEGLNHLYSNSKGLAMQIFEMNVFASPGSPKALQALGEGYMEIGNRELALKFFKESLNIYPDNPFAKDMIKKLKEQEVEDKLSIKINEKISKENNSKYLTDSISTFLIETSVYDFIKYKQSVTEFRKSYIGYKLSTTGKKVYFLCGEYRSESGGPWISFATIKTSPYEQWLGSQAKYACQDSSMVWLNKADSKESLMRVYNFRKN